MLEWRQFFNTRSISADATKYDYVVSVLDDRTSGEIRSVITNPPTLDKYKALKSALLEAFGKTTAQKDAELLALTGLGDRKPTALLRKINALNDDPAKLKRVLLLANLPQDVRSILAGQEFSNVEDVAKAADRIVEARNSSTQVPREWIGALVPNQPEIYAVLPNRIMSNTNRAKHRRELTSQNQLPNNTIFICLCHARYGLHMEPKPIVVKQGAASKLYKSCHCAPRAPALHRQENHSPAARRRGSREHKLHLMISG